MALETIGDYEVVDKLGQGGMGAVYRARQLSLGRLVALKVLPNQFGDDAEFIGRFQREAKVAATLNHANLVRVYAAGQADGCHYIAMELIEGENLHQRMKRERLAIPEALRICADVARGLQYGWDRAQLVHRDIKPSNVYLSRSGEVKVGDLGLAKSLTGNTTGLTQSGTMMGTPHYMSPEQIRGDKALDFRADVYSLGCTLYELLTGHPPYPGSDPISIARAHLDAPLPAIIKALPGCPMPLVRLVGRMLRKTPRERHGTYEDLIAEMDWVREQIEGGAALTATAPRAAAPTTSAPTPRTPATAATAKAKPNTMLYAGIAGAVLVVAALAWWLVPAKPKKTTGVAATTKATAPSPPATSASTPATTSADGWQPLLSEREWKAENKDREFVDGLLHLKPSTISVPQPSMDAAIRARIHIRDDTRTAQLHLRSITGEGNCTLFLNSERTGGELMRSGPPGTAAHGKRFTFSKPLATGDIIQLELRAHGEKLTALVGGELVAELKDHRMTGPGQWGFHGRGAWFESVEVQSLPASHSTSEGWRDAIPELPLGPRIQRTPEGLSFSGPTSTTLPEGKGPRRNGAVRMRGTFGGWRTNLIARSSAQGIYSLCVSSNGSKINLDHWDAIARQATTLRMFDLKEPLKAGQDYELELRVVGDQLTAKFDDEMLATITSAHLAEGQLGVGANDIETLPGPTLIKSVEILDLDAPADEGPWTDMLAPVLAQGQLQDWWKQVGTGLQVSRVQGVILDRTWRENVTIRAIARSEGETAAVWIWLRESDPGRYGAKLENRGRGRIYLLEKGKPDIELAAFDMPAGFSLAENHTIEFRAQGDRLSMAVDGREMAAVNDRTHKSGIFEIMGTPGTIFEKVEVRELPPP